MILTCCTISFIWTIPAIHFAITLGGYWQTWSIVPTLELIRPTFWWEIFIFSHHHNVQISHHHNVLIITKYISSLLKYSIWGARYKTKINSKKSWKMRFPSLRSTALVLCMKWYFAIKAFKSKIIFGWNKVLDLYGSKGHLDTNYWQRTSPMFDSYTHIERQRILNWWCLASMCMMACKKIKKKKWRDSCKRLEERGAINTGLLNIFKTGNKK